MIEVLISPRNVGVHGRAGDIVAAGLAGTTWGLAERAAFRVAAWDDADLEARLTAKQEAGAATPVIGSPYRGTEPTFDICMLPAETVTPQWDASGNPAVDAQGNPVPPVLDTTPVTIDALLARMPEATRNAIMQKAGEVAQAKLMAAGHAVALDVATGRPLPAEPCVPDLSQPMPGPPRRSRVVVAVDDLRRTGAAPDCLTQAELADKVTFDGQAIQASDLHNGMTALVSQLAATSQAATPPVHGTATVGG